MVLLQYESLDGHSNFFPVWILGHKFHKKMSLPFLLFGNYHVLLGLPQLFPKALYHVEGEFGWLFMVQVSVVFLDVQDLGEILTVWPIKSSGHKDFLAWYKISEHALVFSSILHENGWNNKVLSCEFLFWSQTQHINGFSPSPSECCRLGHFLLVPTVGPGNDQEFLVF